VGILAEIKMKITQMLRCCKRIATVTAIKGDSVHLDVGAETDETPCYIIYETIDLFVEVPKVGDRFLITNTFESFTS
jgi:hypothetical protein